MCNVLLFSCFIPVLTRYFNASMLNWIQVRLFLKYRFVLRTLFLLRLMQPLHAAVLFENRATNYRGFQRVEPSSSNPGVSGRGPRAQPVCGQHTVSYSGRGDIRHPRRGPHPSQPPLHTSAPASVRWAQEIEEVLPTHSLEYSDAESVSYAREGGYISDRVTHAIMHMYQCVISVIRPSAIYTFLNQHRQEIEVCLMQEIVW